MALTVVVTGVGTTDGGEGRARGRAAWGSWLTRSRSAPADLATDPDVLTAATGTVLVLAPAAELGAARVAAATVAAVRPDVRVRVEAPPVPVAALVRALELVPGSAEAAGTVHRAVHDALERCVRAAWLPSVTRLERPAPTLRQHLASWVARGAGFLAVDGDPGWVARLPDTSHVPDRRLPRVGPNAAGESWEAHAFGELPEEALASLFQMGLSSRPTRRPGFGDGARAWGSAKAIDVVLAPAGLAASGLRRLGSPAGVCPACEEPVWGSHCPFCRVVARSASQVLGGAA